MTKQTFPRPQEVYATFSLPIMQPAVNETTGNLQCPYRLSQSAALAAACSVVQPLADVLNPRGFVEPLTLFTITRALSGEGKTAAESVFKRGISNFETEQRKAYAVALKEYKEDIEIFNVTRQALANEVRSAMRDGGGVEEAQEALLKHIRSKPVRPKLIRICYDDITPEAWVAAMQENFPAAALYSSEGAAILNGRAFGALEKLCHTWGGGSLSVDRKGEGSVYLAWCRLMLALMVQPEPLKRYLAGKGQKAMELGFWARALVCDAGTTQGTRFVRDGSSSWTNCEFFAMRVEELLNKAADKVGKEGYEPEVLEFSAEAAAHLFTIHNEIEAQNCPGGRYDGAGDHASKLSSNIVRVAGVLHYFEGFEGKISLETLKIAQVICEDASADYLNIFVPPPQHVQDAISLNEWFDKYREDGYGGLPKNYARQNCSGALRKEGRFYAALDRLIEQGVVMHHLDHNMVSQIIIVPEEYRAAMMRGLQIKYYKKS